jgi:hypothetical protein
MGHDGHRLPLEAQLAQQQHQGLLQAGIEPAGGLVQEEDVGLREQLDGDRHALALPAGEPLDGEVLAFRQLQGGQHLAHPPRPLVGARVRRQAQAGRVVQA